ncbi:glycosyltransferase family 2 protein [Leptolyngbya sp. FACHB-261]|uniref:glycosyltransferase family 2 protein n=1 Tax=Leptolyngbya sp. FACHB-261 TaxID=2692806 RepID=UPI001685F730|nr:glycosyltransferase family 2 protein [Leptolyngbya sp. FACHB-261]MBD2101120.1 glycosyltransferase family 2 protein [Leptolyngbya sp. FACHB-261]
MTRSETRSGLAPTAATASPCISVVIIAQDEEERIAQAIRSCQGFADEIVVIDGGSQDTTVQTAETLGCTVYVNPWPGYARQRNFGAQKATHAWIFFIDSDEVVSEELAASLRNWKKQPVPGVDAFSVYRIGDFLGTWLPKGGYLIRLYNKEVFSIKEVLVHEEPDVGNATVGKLPGTLWHHGFRSIEDHVRRFNKYTDLEAQKAYLAGRKFSWARLLLRPPARFLQKYIVQGLYRKGAAGFAVAGFWSYYEFLQEMKVYELHWKNQKPLSGK